MNEKLPIIVGGYSVAATVGSLVLVYGLRTFLRATGDHYCCNQPLYLGQGILLTFIGWTVLLAVAIGIYRERHRMIRSSSASRLEENPK